MRRPADKHNEEHVINPLFQPCSINTLQVKNRIVRSATGEERADANGFVKPTMAAMYEELSDGGTGLIISGHMYVHPDRRCSPAQTGIWKDEHLPGLRQLAQAARRKDARVVAQLNCAFTPPAELCRQDIETIVDCFVAAGLRARRAGFDGIQIHGAHGYLVSAFLTPAANKRNDEYGGDANGRRRILVTILRRMRDALGPDYPILCKLGVVDGKDNSLPIEESVQTAVTLEQNGIDAVEISSTFKGTHAEPAVKQVDAPEKEAYFREQARAVKQAIGVPVMLVGGLRSGAVMRRVIEDGTCDMVSLCRPLIRQPDLPNLLMANPDATATCISCNKCFNPRGTTCIFRTP